MDFKQLIDGITPEVYQQLQRAVEIGKWPDGRTLTEEQRSLCMQAIIAFDQRQPAQHRTGYVPPKNTDCDIPDGQQPLKWKH
ncbi:MAG: YeaC family protein [Porticoccaceae bacterium]